MNTNNVQVVTWLVWKPLAVLMSALALVEGLPAKRQQHWVSHPAIRTSSPNAIPYRY